MKGRAVAVCFTLAFAGPAAASDWPQAGGNPSRSGDQAMAPGALPASLAWAVPTTQRVRTTMVVTGGGEPGTQRVVYGTGDGRLHLRVLATGEPVGDPGGLLIADSTITDTAGTFGGAGLALSAADSSTHDRLGVEYVVHDDGGGVEIARVDAATGARTVTQDEAVPGSLGCNAAGSPLLTPPAADGSRILFFTIKGACGAESALVRVPIFGDAATPGARLGEATFARVDEVTTGAAPSLVVLRDGSGTARFYVAVGRMGGIDLFDAGRAFARTPPTELTRADIVAGLGAGEPAGTPAAPTTAAGLVAGAEGSGTPPASALYVATTAGQVTRVYRLTQDGSVLRVARVGEAPGRPVAPVALDEVVGPRGPEGGGRLTVATTVGLCVLRTDDLGEIAAFEGDFTHMAVSGDYAYAVRNGLQGSIPQTVAVRLSGGAAPEVLPPVDGDTAGQARGAPALARGLVVVGLNSRVAAFRTTDVHAPTVALLGLPRRPRLGRTARVAALVADDRGVGDVSFFLGAVSVASGLTPVGGSVFAAGARYESAINTTPVPPGRVFLSAVATDPSGNPGRARARVTVRCARTRRGTRRADDLRGRGAHDCLRAGRGADKLDGRSGADSLTAGPGNDRVFALDDALDIVRCGPGRDRVTADPGDRVASDCERVRRRR